MSPAGQRLDDIFQPRRIVADQIAFHRAKGRFGGFAAATHPPTKEDLGVSGNPKAAGENGRLSRTQKGSNPVWEIEKTPSKKDLTLRSEGTEGNPAEKFSGRIGEKAALGVSRDPVGSSEGGARREWGSIFVEVPC